MNEQTTKPLTKKEKKNKVSIAIKTIKPNFRYRE